VAEAVERARNYHATSILTICVAPSLAARWLVPRLPRFAARHPGIDLRIAASTRIVDRRESPSTVLDDLRRNGIDVAMIRPTRGDRDGKTGSRPPAWARWTSRGAYISITPPWP
jgi:DNA-binding transcriptional LysR family regulator